MQSIKIVLIIYGGFLLSLLIGNILWEVIDKTIERRRTTKPS